MHRVMNIAIFAIIVLAVILQACAPRAEVAATPASPARETAPAPATKAGWEKDWEDTLAAARKEGEVTVYTTYSADWRVAMNEAISRKYGLSFAVLTGRSDDLMERIWREQRSRLYQADALQLISGKRYSLEAQQLSEILQPLEKVLVLPEVTDPKAWVGGKLPWVDPDVKDLFYWRDYLSVPAIANTELVGPQELKSWDDLLNPKWKGKITLSDPTIGGAANTVMTMLPWGIRDWDWVKRFLQQQDISIQRDYRLMTEWVARGRMAIMIGPRKEEAQSFIDAGAPVRYVNFDDGVITTFGAGTIGMMKGSPHPNAAKVFINFLLTREGQTITAKVGGFPSARLDVPTNFLDPAVLRRPGMKAFSTDDKDYLAKQAETDRMLKTVMEPYLKK
ncbi:MAG: extracellular solute-binding protein [Chloroflexi bacterium]|nr:extracellular solute-binding protein [Chloroflexota bacterium]